MIDLQGKLKDVKKILASSSLEELQETLKSQVEELHKLYLVHKMEKLKDTSLLAKRRKNIAMIITALRIKNHAS